jgi:hypothetical protein
MVNGIVFAAKDLPTETQKPANPYHVTTNVTQRKILYVRPTKVVDINANPHRDTYG